MKIKIDLLGKHEIFSFEDYETGEKMVFASGIMAEFAENYCGTISPDLLKSLSIKIDPEHVRIVKERRGIEQPRIDRLSLLHIDKPIVGAFARDGSFIIVDGNHRFVKRHQMGFPNIKAFCFCYPFWRQFLIGDMLKPEFTENLFNTHLQGELSHG